MGMSADAGSRSALVASSRTTYTSTADPVDSILGLFGAWPMVLLGGVVLGGVAVLVPIAVVFSLRVVESAIVGTRHALQEGVRWLATRGRARQLVVEARLRLSRERRQGVQ
jgi:hypothetical protein